MSTLNSNLAKEGVTDSNSIALNLAGTLKAKKLKNLRDTPPPHGKKPTLRDPAPNSTNPPPPPGPTNPTRNTNRRMPTTYTLVKKLCFMYQEQYSFGAGLPT